MFAALLQRRGFWWAFCVGVVAHLLSLFALLVLYWLLRPFVWAAVYGVPYSPPPGPYDPNSGEWLFVQAISVLSWIAAGLAAARWSSRGFPWAVASLVVITTVLLIWADIPTSSSEIRITLYVAGTPLGLVCGAAIYMLYHRAIPSAKAVHDT